eukprot:1139334-Pelagomonas_calceolata.AAC.12
MSGAQEYKCSRPRNFNTLAGIAWIRVSWLALEPPAPCFDKNKVGGCADELRQASHAVDA